MGLDRVTHTKIRNSGQLLKGNRRRKLDCTSHLNACKWEVPFVFRDRSYIAPDPRMIAGMVFTRIERSSQIDQRSM